MAHRFSSARIALNLFFPKCLTALQGEDLMCGNLWLSLRGLHAAQPFFMCVREGGVRDGWGWGSLRSVTLGLNKEEHDEPNSDRRWVFVRMLGSLSRFGLGGQARCASPPLPADTTWLCARLPPWISSLFPPSCQSGSVGGDGLEPDAVCEGQVCSVELQTDDSVELACGSIPGPSAWL